MPLARYVDVRCVLSCPTQTKKDPHGEINIWTMTFNEYLELCRDIELTSTKGTGAYVEVVWTQAREDAHTHAYTPR